MADIVAMCLGEIRDQRPFLDTEHGPIHAFKDKHKTLPAAFDDEYFRHMQWAHLASGGAGGGMRWPNRKPHTLTPGMRVAQHGLAKFLPLIDWNRFDRRCWNERVSASVAGVDAFGCGDDEQALLWMLRTDVRKDGTLDPKAAPVRVELTCPGRPGAYEVTHFETRDGQVLRQERVECQGEQLTIPAELRTDLAFAVRRLS
jgi:mannan endo-1,4-beta-mannosidase